MRCSRPDIRYALVFSAALGSACGKEGPTAPSDPPSFLVGTWRGTVTIQVNPGDPVPRPAETGSTTWSFVLLPNTNGQSFRASIRSTHPWLPTEIEGSAALTPGNTAPAQISTQGEFNSPRGCRATFGSVGVAEATRVEADFTGTDCQQATFAGRVTLTKD
jgi:hypothetical protein